MRMNSGFLTCNVGWVIVPPTERGDSIYFKIKLKIMATVLNMVILCQPADESFINIFYLFNAHNNPMRGGLLLRLV
jgi:hypothetical protein